MILLIDFARFSSLCHEAREAVQGAGFKSLGVGFYQPAGVLPLLGHGTPSRRYHASCNIENVLRNVRI